MSLLGPGLEAFLSVVQQKTVQSASKNLGMTQTGVTQRIRALEAQLAATLFIRSRRGMLLTPEGESLLRYCLTVRDLEGETLTQIQDAGRAADVRVRMLGPTSLMRTRVVPHCLPVLKKFPHLLFSFMISDTASTAADSLRSGQTQFAILPREEVAREMDSKLLQPEQYVLVGPKRWKSRNIEETVRSERIIDFEVSDQMTFAYLKKFRLLAAARPDRHFVNNNESLLEMLEQGLGYGVLTREFAELYLQRADIVILNNGLYLDQRLALAWYPRPQLSPYFKAIIDAIR